jgi:hypothetical protein
MAAAAEQTWRTIRSIVLDDGTRLWVSEGQFADLRQGDQVQAVFETKRGKKVVTQLYRRPPGPDGTADPLDSVQGWRQLEPAR